MFFRRAAKRRSLQKRLSTRALARRRLRKRRKWGGRRRKVLRRRTTPPQWRLALARNFLLIIRVKQRFLKKLKKRKRRRLRRQVSWKRYARSHDPTQRWDCQATPQYLNWLFWCFNCKVSLAEEERRDTLVKGSPASLGSCGRANSAPSNDSGHVSAEPYSLPSVSSTKVSDVFSPE